MCHISVLITICTALLSAVPNIQAQKDPHFAPGRNTIVHLFEWKWSDIAAECERFLGPMGFGGVQTSPPNENLIIGNRPWWERYQPVSYKLETKSGNEQDFADMTRRCNAVGVRIYIDTVINHMAAGSGTGTGGSPSNYDNEEFPAVPFTRDDFHTPCALNNWQDIENVRTCQLNGLLDLDHTRTNVRSKIVEFMDHVIDLGVAGFRVDAAKLIWPDDLRAIFEATKDLSQDARFPAGARPYFFQEINDFGTEPIKETDYTPFGSIIEFKVGNFLGIAFHGNNALANLENWGTDWGLVPSGDSLVFIDNHDNQRAGPDNIILTYKNSKPYKMAIAFMLAHPYGVTRLMSSYYFDNNDQGPPAESPGINDDDTCSNGWVCEHRWREIYNMVGFRNAVEGTDLTNWWSNGAQQIAFCRGNKGFIAITNGGDFPNTSLNTCLPAGTYCDIISGSLSNMGCTGKSVQVDDDGQAVIPLGDGELDGVLAIHINAKV